MLKDVLNAVENAQGPIRLDTLGEDLGIEPSALEGMIEFWQRKGKLTLTTFGDNGFVYQGGTCTQCSEILACTGENAPEKSCCG
mgnify:CR=1 FL=1